MVMWVVRLGWRVENECHASRNGSIEGVEDMMMSSNWNIFRVTGHLCGEFTGDWWIPRTKANDAEIWFFFDLRLNKRLSKQS